MTGPSPLRHRPGLFMPGECRHLIDRGALVAISSSAGKDSQAMTILLSRVVPPEQLLVVHAPLGEVERPETVAHVRNTIPPGVPLVFARVASGKTLLEHIEERVRFPDSRRRYCTAGTKRGPIERELRRYMRDHPRFEGRIVSALGLRRDESRDRAKRIPWKRSERNSRAGREWFDWLPIFHLTETQVFRVIAEAGQAPHWAYGAGMSRVSCSFCILASRAACRARRPRRYGRDCGKGEAEAGDPPRLPLRGERQVADVPQVAGAVDPPAHRFAQRAARVPVLGNPLRAPDLHGDPARRLLGPVPVERNEKLPVPIPRPMGGAGPPSILHSSPARAVRRGQSGP